MKLPEYQDLASKKRFMEQIVINTPKEFDNWFEGFGDERFIYRGSCEAKYMNFTFAQRDWITKEWTKVLQVSFVEYVDRLISKISNNNLLLDYFKSLNIRPNDILWLSFMQHYGMPTPLLDFTKDKKIGLFFATDGLKHDPSDVDVENYFSFYALKRTDTIFPVDTLFASGIENGKRLVEEFRRNNPGAQINDSILRNIDEMTKWIKKDGSKDGLSTMPFLFVPNPLDAKVVESITGERLYWSNPNIIAQKGCFVISTNDSLPLEEAIAKNGNNPPLISVDIHKSLVDYIKKNYISDLNHDNIYPKFKKQAEIAYDEFKSNF